MPEHIKQEIIGFMDCFIKSCCFGYDFTENDKTAGFIADDLVMGQTAINCHGFNTGLIN